MNLLKKFKNIEVLTPSGFKSFDGIIKNTKQEYIKIILVDNTYLICSVDHLILIENDEFKFAKNLSINDYIFTETGLQKIESIEYHKDKIDLYDLTNVQDINHTYYTNGIASHNCKFLGGEDTLISPDVLQDIITIDPKEKHFADSLKIFKQPIQGHNYFMTVDVSRAKGLDSSAFTILDVTAYPFEVVCHYSDPNIQNLIFPSIINRLGRIYNEAAILVEINDNGQQVADLLFEEWEYPNLLGCAVKGRVGQVLTVFGPRTKGLKTSVSTKRVGCANLKTLIETKKLNINSFDILRELTNFILKGSSYESEKGSHDDLVMCLVNFSWASQQMFFKNYVQLGLREVYEEQLEQFESLPLGIYVNNYDNFDDGFRF